MEIKYKMNVKWMIFYKDLDENLVMHTSLGYWIS